MLQQWWYRVGVAVSPARAGAAKASFRDLLRLRAEDDYPDRSAAPRNGNAAADYPYAASAFGVEGSVTVGFRRDAAGRPADAEVVARRLQVPGVRDGPSVAFGSVFDAPSVQRALALPAAPGRTGPDSQGFAWRLQ